MDRNRVIGVDNRLPWRLPEDLHRFRRLTLGKPIIMGRKTHESIGRPLDGRTNIVISRGRNYRSEGCRVVDSLTAALEICPDADEVMVIGGESIYVQALPLAKRLYLTLIDAAFDGDTYFPRYEPRAWRETERERHAAVEGAPSATGSAPAHAFSFVTLERR